MSLKRRTNIITTIKKSKKGGFYIPTAKHNTSEIVRRAEPVKTLPPVISEAQDAVKQAQAEVKEEMKKKRTYKKRAPAAPKKTGVKKKTLKKKKASGKKTIRRRKVAAKTNVFDLIRAVKVHRKKK